MRRATGYILFIILMVAFLPAAAGAEPASVPWRSDISAARLLSSVDSVAPGTPFTVGLDIRLAPGWHTYTDPSGDAGLPAQFTWNLPPGFAAGNIQYPPHRTFTEGGLTTYGYVDHVLLPVRITPPAAFAGDVALHLKAGWLACKDICIPQEAEFALTLPPGAGTASGFAPLFGNTEMQKCKNADGSACTSAPPHPALWFALLSALLGGLILNLMPCVFPVLSLKCLAVARHAHSHPKQARREGLAYTAGVLLCFTVLGGLLIALQQAGAAVGWGYQMQSPVFVAAMALLLFLVGLSLSGLFMLPVLLGDAHAGSNFATGLLAALVATPCTAPLMAPAVGFALTQPPLVAMCIFEMIGLGLAAPFLLVSFAPKSLAWLPKPGAWMARLKEVLAFPMYASSIWLLWVLAQQDGANAVAALLLAMLLCVFGMWLKLRQSIFLLLVVVIAAATLEYVHRLPPMPSMMLAQEGGEAFSEARLAQLRAGGTPVFVDATAAWCITCRVNYYSTLARDEVREAFKKRGVKTLVADWTSENTEITHYLASFGRSGVPMYVYYPPRGEPKLLPQVLTPGVVLGVVE